MPETPSTTPTPPTAPPTTPPATPATPATPETPETPKTSASAQKATTSKWEKISSKLADGANLLVRAAVQLATISFDEELESISARVDSLMIEIDALARKNSLSASLVGDAYVSSVNNSIASVMSGINEGAYASAQTVIDLGAQDKMRQLEFEKIELERSNSLNLREAQKQANLSNLNASKHEAIATIAAESTRMAAHAADGITFGVSGAVGDLTASIAEGTTSALTTVIGKENDLIVKYWENEKHVTEAQLNAVQDVEKEWIQSAAHVEKAWLQFTQQLENKLLQADLAANDMGIGMGLNGEELARFKSDMMFQQFAVAARWGKSLTEMQQHQNTYQENSGRNIQMSDRDFDTTFAMDKLAGTDGLSIQLASAMVPFNKSIASSNDMVFEMFQNVSKIGLSGRQYMKDLLKNLKLAEKHQFKGGVKGLMQMAAWASKTKFNLDSLDSMLDKVSEGGLEGVITQAAQLQVLGGFSAMGADPLAMMFERYNDPEAYAKRMNGMTRGMGTFDEKTGETWFNAADQMRIEAMAKAQGRSKEDLFTEVRERNKRANIEKKVQPGRFNDQQLTAISSKAQWNQDKGQWEVTMNNGLSKAVTDLYADDIKNIMPTETNEKIEIYVRDIRDMMTRLTSANAGMQAGLQNDSYADWLAEENQRITQVTSDFYKNYNEYLSQVKEKMSVATNAQKTMLDMMGAGNANIDAEIEAVRQAGVKLAATINDVTALIASNLTEVNRQAALRAPLARNPDTGEPEVAYDKTHRERIDKRWFMWHPGRALPIGWDDPINNAISDASITGKPKETSSEDSVMQSTGGRPMITAATSVTPIHDGTAQLAQSDPKDTAIFAKDGGPFDTLFNKVFGRIDGVYSMLANHPEVAHNGFVSPRSREVVIQSAERLQSATTRPYSPPINTSSMQLTQSDQKASELKITFDKPISLDGRLELTGGNQSINIISELQGNPQLLRTITQMLSEAISKNMFGGRAVNNNFNLTGGLGMR